MDKTSLGFQKPKEEEYYDINIFNQNAQLANNLIEKNSSAIGQKLDKESSFYADLEAYYGNTKLISDFQDISKYTLLAGQSFATDSSNTKIGNNSIKLTSQAVGMSSLKMNNIVLDLTSLNNGEISSDEDYIYCSLYISDITKIDVSTPNAITLRFSQSEVYTDTDSKIFQGNKGFNTNSLVNGWNFLKLKKSEALTMGNGSWSGIKSCFFAFVATTSTSTFVSFQLIQLLKKDPLEDKPNPFQKFGVREFDIDSGEWFVGKELDNLVCKELLGDSAILSSLINPTVFQDFIASAKIETNSIIKRFLGAVTQDGTSYFYIQTDSLGLAQIVTYIEGTTKVISTPFKVNVGDPLTLSAERRRDKIIATYTSNGNSVVLTADFNVSQKMKLALGRDGSSRNVVYSSASITEISHAHHSDIAENLAESGKIDLLRKPKSILIGSGNNRIMQLGFFNYLSSFNLYAKIMRPNLHNGSQLSYADLYLGKYSSSYSVEGKLQMNIDLSTQQYKLRFVVTDTGKLYAISPLYNYSDWIIIENKNFTEDIREVSVIDGNIVWDSDNNTTKIALQQTPTETVITSGFGSGWSGVLKYGVTQEGELYINHSGLTKTNDILPFEVLYALPSSLGRYIGSNSNIGVASNGGIINNSTVTLYLESGGRLIATNHGSVTVGVRKIISGAIFATQF